MTMEFPIHVKHLMGFIIQITEYKYSVPALRNDLISDGV